MFFTHGLLLIIRLAELQTICKEYWNKIARLENDKYDLEIIEQFKKMEVNGQNPHDYLYIIYITFSTYNLV